MSRYFRIYTCNTKFITDKAAARQNMLKLAVYEAEHDGLCLQLPVPADSAGYKSNGINVDYLYGGRPYLPCHPDIFISISHSGDYLVIALSDFSIGVDIQEHRSVSNSIWERFYPADDSALLTSIKDPVQREDLFFMTWAIRESYTKFTGRGLSEDLRSFHIDHDKCTITSEKGSPNAYYVELEPPSPGCSFAACSGDPAVIPDVRIL